MKNSGPGIDSARFLRCPLGTAARGGLVLLLPFLVGLFGGSFVSAHTPIVDSNLSDWCIGAFSNSVSANGRVEDSGVVLMCGNCSSTTDLACEVSSDCPGGESCVNTTSKVETVWWDDREDGSVNDLATVAITQDANNLYVAAELWVDPDPQSLPFGEVAIDYASGGLAVWHDPSNNLKGSGRCNISTDRACTSNADCHFCAGDPGVNSAWPSREFSGSCSGDSTVNCRTNSPDCNAFGGTCVKRVRTCGSACDPGPPAEPCDTSQVCVGVGATGPKRILGAYAAPKTLADYLIVFDFSIWLVDASLPSVRVMQPGTTLDATSPWDPVTGCATATGFCDFVPRVFPGASGGSGGPPGRVEVAIPWAAFPGGFGPGQDFRFTMTVARGTLSLDFTPDGAHEDVLSEVVANTTSTTSNSCAAGGATNTDCESADSSLDAFIPLSPSLPHELAPGGRVCGLLLSKATPNITLGWVSSCSVADNDYGVYEGTIGAWYSHVIVGCSTGGPTNSTFAPAAGDRYYLVVPTDGATEGSYGKNGGGIERPASAGPCAAQSIGNCP